MILLNKLSSEGLIKIHLLFTFIDYTWIIVLIVIIFAFVLLFTKTEIFKLDEKKEFNHSSQNNLSQSLAIRTGNFKLLEESLILRPKQKLALSENICLLFADEKSVIIGATEERIKLSSRKNERILVISSILNLENINLKHFKTEDFLWKYSDSYFKFDFDLIVICCEYPYNGLRKFIKDAIRDCDKVFVSIINKTEVVLEDFKEIGKEFVLVNFKKPYLGGIKKFEKTKEIWSRKKYKTTALKHVNSSQEKHEPQKKQIEEVIIFPQETEKNEIYAEPLSIKSNLNIDLSTNIKIFVSEQKEQCLKEKFENLLKDDQKSKILLVTYHTSKFIELFQNLLLTKKLKIINPWILKNLKEKEKALLEHKIVFFDEFYIDSRGIFSDIVKLFLENNKRIFGFVNRKEFNSEAGIKFKNDFPVFETLLIEGNKNC